MTHFAVAFGLLAHLLFWGVGLAVLVMPRPWGRFWPVLIVPCGLVLQSAVVWIGAHLPLAGTNSYAWPSEIVPAALLAAVVMRRGWGALVVEARRFTGIYAAVAGCLILLVTPLALASAGLTTISLGSCDAADYAGGARVLMEFTRSDRQGFLGLTEVVQVHSVDNFFDYWLRLNHFTPAALIALNGSILDCAPHELTTLVSILLLATSLPVVFWTARALARLSPAASWVAALLYGASPITWYAVGHVAPGQMLAAEAMALLAWVGVVLWHRLATGSWRRGLAMAGVLVVAYGLVLGSYNFILLVCLVPALAYAGGLTLSEGLWGRFIRWGALMVAPLAIAGVFFATRVAGMTERFMLLQAYDFGWPIPVLTPEGWLGFVGNGPTLAPAATWVRILVSVVVVAVVIASVSRRRVVAWRIACLALPALTGCAYLQWRAATLGTNASYDAYKLLAVFFPGVLAASLVWVSWRPTARVLRWSMPALAAVVIAAHVYSVSQYIKALENPPLRVTTELRNLRTIETMDDVASLNLRISDMWSRLWANAFLLKKPHYFPTHTYEARRNTPLRGEWDLLGDVVELHLPGDQRRQVTPRFALVDARSASRLRAAVGPGWYPEERGGSGEDRWRWAEDNAVMILDNPTGHPLKVSATLDGWVNGGERDLSLALEGQRRGETIRMTRDRAKYTFPPLMLPPGRSTLVLHSAQPALQAGPGDPRRLAVCVFGLDLTVAEKLK